MATLTDKIKFLLETLSLELEQGVGFLQVAKHIKQSQSEGRLKRNTKFFELVSEACMREALLSLAKLAISGKESVTVNYLLNCAREVPSKLFPGATRREIERSVAEHKRRLEDLAPLIDALRTRRDRVLAHLDRKHVNEPEALTASKIDLGEVEEAFGILAEMINTYRRYFGMPDVSLRETGLILQGEVDVLVKLMAQAD